MSNIEKNTKIRETYLATKAKRASQCVRVFTAKIQTNKLSREQQQSLKMMFVEAKWMYNHVLNLQANSNTDIFNLKYTDLNTITHFDKDKNSITSELIYLSSQMKQEVLTQIFTNIRALGKSKKVGNKVGKLRFISEYNSINLKQANVSYKIIGKNKVKIQGIKKPFKANGLEQFITIPNYELANAKLLYKPSGYYIAFTVYTPKENNINTKKQKIGIDFGCQTSFTLSDGRKFNCIVEESDRLKTLQRKIAKAKKGSNNRYRLKQQLRKAYEKDTNKKNDLANQLCSVLKEYNVVIQDEQLRAWKRKHGKKIQHSILGRVKAKLINKADTIVLNRFVPTTKFCNKCGHIYDISLWDRTYTCPNCGETMDRDVHAAQNMLWFAENKIGMGRTEFKREDFENAIRGIFEGMNHEAANSLD